MAVDEFGREVQSSYAPPSPRAHSQSYGDEAWRERNSVSPSPSYRRRRRERDDDHRRHGDDRHERRERSYSREEWRNRKHPSEKYANEVMLCQYVWEQQLLQARRAEKNIAGEAETKSHPPTEEPKSKMETDPDVVKDETKIEEDPLFSTPEEATAAYLSYNSKYCLNYVRTFFNSHLDDAWFRLRLSPGAQYSLAKVEKNRSNLEAMEMRKEILYSLEENALGVIPKKDPDCPDYLGPPKCSFVSGCRLGVGTKPTNKRYGDHGEFVLSGDDRNRIERHAKSHLHSFVKIDAVVKIIDVPSNISDEQLSLALARFTDKKEISIWSGDVHIPTLADEKEQPYHRYVFVSFPSRDAKEAMLEKLNRYNEDHGHYSRSRRMPRLLELEVDCTDAYGRKEVDADGMGGAPLGKKAPLTPKSCRVNVSTVSLATNQPVSVLSAAVSSRGRIAKDRQCVGEVAKILDEVREVARENRLADLLRLLYPTDAEWRGVDDEDVLDVSIAYLRRVHLFSFYNGCVTATSVGSVLAHSHPVGTIHLRLRNADDILNKMVEDRGGAVESGDAGLNAESNVEETVAKDMLVMRLNDSIEKAFESLNGMSARGPGCLINEETDAVAKNIEDAERETKNSWLENHGTIDEDGR